MYCAHEPDRMIEGVGIADIDAEGRYLEAQFGNLSVVSFYLPSGSTSQERLAIKFRFLERVDSASASACRQRARGDHLRRLEHRTPARSISRTGARTKKIRASCRKSARGSRGVFDHLGYVDVFRRWIDRDPNSTRGGPIAARPGQKTSDGALTIRSLLRGLLRKRPAHPSTRPDGSPITHRSPSTTITSCERVVDARGSATAGSSLDCRSTQACDTRSNHFCSSFQGATHQSSTIPGIASNMHNR